MCFRLTQCNAHYVGAVVAEVVLTDAYVLQLVTFQQRIAELEICFRILEHVGASCNFNRLHRFGRCIHKCDHHIESVDRARVFLMQYQLVHFVECIEYGVQV